MAQHANMPTCECRSPGRPVWIDQNCSARPLVSGPSGQEEKVVKYLAASGAPTAVSRRACAMRARKLGGWLRAGNGAIIARLWPEYSRWPRAKSSRLRHSASAHAYRPSWFYYHPRLRNCEPAGCRTKAAATTTTSCRQTIKMVVHLLPMSI